MNIILIVSDTLRRDFIGFYGNRWISTPNIDKFAEISVVFDRAYIGSFPTVPHRHDILTGKFAFTYHKWAPLPEQDVTIPKFLEEKGYITMGIFDTPHPFAPGMNYQRDFYGWNLIRGQEHDHYITDPIDTKLPCSPEKLRNPESTIIKHYLKNISIRKYEEDYFCAQTFIEASRWIEKNYKHKKFFLYIDTFDPHEPWDPPEYLVDMYNPDYKGEEIIYPKYGSTDIFTKEEINHCRALYAGEVTLVDRWFGHFLRKVEDTGLLKNTCIIFTADHGFYLGEHNLIGKSTIKKGYFSYTPLYEEIVRIPLIMYMPGIKHRKIQSFVQPPDIPTTILDIAKVRIPSELNGRSLLPLLEGKKKQIRDFVISTPSIINGSTGGVKITITNQDGWCYICEGEKGGSFIFLKDVDSISRKPIKKFEGEELYFLPDDPNQKRNLIGKNKEIAEKLRRKFISFLRECRTDEKIINLWEKGG